MKNYIFKLAQKPLVQGTFWVTAGGMVGSLGNYAFNLIMGRLLSPGDFGIVTTFMSLVFIISIPSSIVVTIVTKFTADFSASDSPSHIRLLARKLTKYTLVIGVFLLFSYSVFKYVVSSYVHITDETAILVTLAMIAMGFIASVNQGIMRGLLKFKLLTLFNLGGIMVKLFLGWYLVVRQFAVVGALIGNLMSIVIPWALAYVPLKSYFSSYQNASIGLKKKLVSYSIPTFAVTAAITLFLSIDIVLVKHYFSEFDTGIYSAVSIMGKAIYYALSPVAIVLFPIIAQKYAKKENFLKELIFSIGLTLVPGLCALVVYFVLPQLVVSLFFPADGFRDTIEYIGLYGLYMLVFTITSLLIHFFLAIENTRLSLYALSAVVLQIGGIMIYHGSISEVILVSLTATSVLLALLLNEAVRVYRQR